MTALWQVSAVVIAMLKTFASAPGTLGTVAKREAIRRQLVPSSQTTLTNMTLPDPPPAAVSTSSAPPTMTEVIEPPVGGDVEAKKGEEPKKAEEPKKDEAWWRNRIAAARQALAQDEAAILVAQGRANSLTTEVVNIDDPAKQMLLRQQLLTALAEVERLKAQIAAGTKTIADIQTEARRSGIPPGWIR